MDLTKKEQSKWLAVVILAIVFISIVTVQVRPGSSENLPAYKKEAQVETIDTINLGVTKATPRIQAICISDSGKSSAYIGGKSVNEGDTVNGFKILKIYPTKVEFERHGNIVVGVFPDKRRPIRPNSDSFLRKQASYKSSANYGVRYRQPSYSIPRVSENGSYYGQISENTGRPKTVHVSGYYRKDGTYVRSHYRSPPRR